MISNIKNGQLAKKAIVFQKRQKLCESVLKILWTEGFITGFKISEQNINIFLKYHANGKPAIDKIKSLSKPGKRLYYSSKQIWKINSTKGLIVISTNKGLKSLYQCKQLKIGGEPLLIII